MYEPVYRAVASLKVVWSLIECRWSGHTQSGLVISGDPVCPNGLLMLIIVKGASPNYFFQNNVIVTLSWNPPQNVTPPISSKSTCPSDHRCF